MDRAAEARLFPGGSVFSVRVPRMGRRGTHTSVALAPSPFETDIVSSTAHARRGPAKRSEACSDNDHQGLPEQTGTWTAAGPREGLCSLREPCRQERFSETHTRR